MPVVQGTTSGLPNGFIWDNGRYFIEKQNRQYVVFDHGYFEVHSSKSKKDAIKWAEIKTATLIFFLRIHSCSFSSSTCKRYFSLRYCLLLISLKALKYLTDTF